MDGIVSCIETLEALVDDRGLLADVDEPLRKRLLVAAGRVSRPARAELRHLAKTRRKRKRDKVRERDERQLEQTGIRSLRRAPVFQTPYPEPEPEATSSVSEDAAGAHTTTPQKCYVCKASFHTLHHFYDQMCPVCAELNWDKRNQTADLSGRVALVTGARVKIGYQAAIKLLRAGAHVVVTTRFPKDAALRFRQEPDFDDYRHRLDIHGLDLRYTPSVERFCEHLARTLPRLDYILNNACQTVRRPSGFYAHLIEAERENRLEQSTQRLLASHVACTADGPPVPTHTADGAIDSAELSQLAVLPEDRGRDLRLFPEGQLDADLQQVDLRDRNSWRLRLHEVSTVELLEVHLVNAVAPYVINGRLRPLMEQTPGRDQHIVNVSAMEGQFYRAWKTDKHPHTNMAKAALNMMTRTSASDYEKDGIHMNSVDTGWVTDEDPAAIAARKIAEHGFHPPLDIVDGAARIVDPIFHGVLTGEFFSGLFLKDYRPIRW